MYFLPSQSVNDLRYYEYSGANLVIMAYIVTPDEAPAQSISPTAITWTAPS